MEKEEAKNQKGGACNSNRVPEPDFLLQWGNRKRLRCMKVRGEDLSDKSDVNGGGGGGVGIRKKTISRIDRRVVKDSPSPISPNRLNNNNNNNNDNNNNYYNNKSSADSAALRKSQSCSPEKEDRYYTTRGSVMGFEDNGKMFMDTGEDKGFVWPRLFISLSSKEKEEDFMAMKGCKLPQRPKKRAKFIQRSLLLVSPGAWLSDLCQERYEVREKKTSKKRPRGLKAMGSMESDSE
ncbi:hypothetical protein Syun_017205 [Stephania yunnanensis]|uniref:Uncharacterized protein n=1 Tax=Stephania yunnanensis TaxID=152371 RepID=A0AAP0P2V0_9MAGN